MGLGCPRNRFGIDRQQDYQLVTLTDELAPAVGFEPTTIRLTVERSTIELCWNKLYKLAQIITNDKSSKCGYPSWGLTSPKCCVTFLYEKFLS